MVLTGFEGGMMSCAENLKKLQTLTHKKGDLKLEKIAKERKGKEKANTFQFFLILRTVRCVAESSLHFHFPISHSSFFFTFFLLSSTEPTASSENH
jgi:hypothetical protein